MKNRAEEILARYPVGVGTSSDKETITFVTMQLASNHNCKYHKSWSPLCQRCACHVLSKPVHNCSTHKRNYNWAICRKIHKILLFLKKSYFLDRRK